MKKIGLIVAHEEDAQGAKNYLGQSEYMWSLPTLAEVQRILQGMGFMVFLCRRGKGLDYSQVNQIYESNGGVDLSLELHFNSAGKGARGQEMLVLKGYSEETAQIAKKICEHIFNVAKITRRRDEGLYYLNSWARGAVCLERVKYAKHVMLYEPAFGNYETQDSRYIFANDGKEFAHDLAAAIEKAFKTEGYPVQEDDSAKIKRLEAKVGDLEAVIDFKREMLTHVIRQLEEIRGK